MDDDQKRQRTHAPVTSSRRTFLYRLGGVLGLGATAWLAGLPASGSPRPGTAEGAGARDAGVVVLRNRRTTLLDHLNQGAFASHVNTRFTFSGADGTVELTLREARTIQTPGAGPAAGESFSLEFRGPASHPLEQGVYSVSHRGLGTFELFIVPVGQDAGSRHYEAVFNRVTS